MPVEPRSHQAMLGNNTQTGTQRHLPLRNKYVEYRFCWQSGQQPQPSGRQPAYAGGGRLVDLSVLLRTSQERFMRVSNGSNIATDPILSESFVRVFFNSHTDGAPVKFIVFARWEWPRTRVTEGNKTSDF
jgi:hypothetical protein